jgi:hypothetical protein
MPIIDQLATATMRAVNTRGPRQRQMVRSLLALGAEAATERDTLLGDLERMWHWLERHPTDPRHDDRELAFLAKLNAYERLVDAMRDAERGIVETPHPQEIPKAQPRGKATCPNCGTMLRPGMTACPRCHPPVNPLRQAALT